MNFLIIPYCGGGQKTSKIAWRHLWIILKQKITFLINFDAVSPSGDELLPLEEGVGESVVVVGTTRFTVLGEGNL